MDQGSAKLLVRGSGKLVGRPLRLLASGNDKVGDEIHVFNLPAMRTCPGRSWLCQRECYARVRRWRFANVKTALARNFWAARRSEFPQRLICEIISRHVRIVRIHASGDFFSAAYISHWISIVQAVPEVTFFAYMRSGGWRIWGGNWRSCPA